MRTLFDTSVFVAAAWEGHPHSHSAQAWILRAKRSEFVGLVSRHAMLEAYAVLTRLPVSPRLAPGLVIASLTDLLARVEIVGAAPHDYLALLQEAGSRSLTGGIVYDLLHLHCARIAGAQRIVTGNPKDFQRLLTDELIEIVDLAPI